jgi:hypothetical protein
MVVQLALSPDVESVLREQAAALGIDVQTFVLKALTEKLAESRGAEPSIDPLRDRQQQISDCIALHPISSGVLDDRRSSIYEGRGE